jgi:ketosteroid isomerase-like protein
LPSVNFNEGVAMSASVIQFFYDAMRSMDPGALAASFHDDVVVIEPPSLPYGGTTTSREEFFQKVAGYTDQRSTFQLVSSEVLGDGDRLAGHFTATFTAHGSGETFLLDQTELYEVTDGAISKVEVFQHDTPGLIEFFAKNPPTARTPPA